MLLPGWLVVVEETLDRGGYYPRHVLAGAGAEHAKAGAELDGEVEGGAVDGLAGRLSQRRFSPRFGWGGLSCRCGFLRHLALPTTPLPDGAGKRLLICLDIQASSVLGWSCESGNEPKEPRKEIE